MITDMMIAVEHADKLSEGWQDEAFEMLCDYAEPGKEFTAVDFRTWALRQGFDVPAGATRRAWGAVLARGRRAGLIQSAGARMCEGMADELERSNPTVRNVWRCVT